jgi:hypothetical protein
MKDDAEPAFDSTSLTVGRREFDIEQLADVPCAAEM